MQIAVLGQSPRKKLQELSSPLPNSSKHLHIDDDKAKSLLF